MKQAVEDTKRYAAALHGCEESEVYHRSTEIVAWLEECTQILKRLEPQISQLESEISIMESVISKTTSELEIIKIAQGLEEYGETRRKTSFVSLHG